MEANRTPEERELRGELMRKALRQRTRFDRPWIEALSTADQATLIPLLKGLFKEP